MGKLKVGDRVKVLKYWHGEGIIQDIYPNDTGYKVKMVTGPQAHVGSGGFELDEVELVKPVVKSGKSTMSIVSIKRSTQKTGLKIYGKVLGESGKTYNFAYIRRPNFRGWICSCENFFFDMFKKGRNCKHLHFVRNEVGRFGTKVPKS